MYVQFTLDFFACCQVAKKKQKKEAMGLGSTKTDQEREKRPLSPWQS
jgi:hypothetical protein